MNKKELRKEKNKVLIKFTLIFVVLLGAGIFLLFHILANELNLNGNRKEIFKYVNENVEGLEAFVSNMSFDSYSLSFDFITGIYKYSNDDTMYVKFPVGGSGFGPSGCYDGFYYSEKDIIHKYDYSDWTIYGDDINKYFIDDVDKSSDDYVLIEKIRDHWYYYERCF